MAIAMITMCGSSSGMLANLDRKIDVPPNVQANFERDKMTDKEILINLTKQMGLAQTGDEITQNWHNDAVWFDLQFYRMEGLENCRNEFNSQFNKISNVQTEFPEIEAFVDGNVGFVRSIQRFKCDNLDGSPSADFLTRQTDCYIKENGNWKLIHQHVSLPTDFSTGKAIFSTKLD